MAARRSPLPGLDGESGRARPARRRNAAARRQGRPSRPDGVPRPLERRRLERGWPAARLPQSGRGPGRPFGRPRVLLRPGPCRRTGRLVCRDFAGGAVSLRRRRRDLERCRRLQRRSLSEDRRQGDGSAGGIDPARCPRGPAGCPHLYIALSTGGVFESADRGVSWRALNRGVEAYFLPEPDAEFGHDPHAWRCARSIRTASTSRTTAASTASTGPADTWQRIGQNMPAEVGDIGFALALHPRDPDTLWVFPDGRHRCVAAHQPRGRPAVYCSTGRRRGHGGARTVACRRRTRLVQRQAPGPARRRRAIRSASISAPPAARSG
ncbi:MAG: hypothetical protein MZW92_38110 [Comamonadaceae bacterium]|nr:hypothetical protein [Comamonadaceae bacterium]